MMVEGLTVSNVNNCRNKKTNAASAMKPKLLDLMRRMPNLPPLHLEVQQIEHFGSRKQLIPGDVIGYRGQLG